MSDDPIHDAQERGADFLDAMKRVAFAEGEQAMAEARKLDEATVRAPLEARITEVERERDAALAREARLREALRGLSAGMNSAIDSNPRVRAAEVRAARAALDYEAADAPQEPRDA